MLLIEFIWKQTLEHINNIRFGLLYKFCIKHFKHSRVLLYSKNAHL